jgi:Protein of unknown function (DUF2442)
MTLHRIKSLQADDALCLTITWDNGERTFHELGAFLATRHWAKPLMDPTVFRSAQVTQDGYQIVWPGTDIDFSAAGLWEDIHPRPAPVAPWMSAEDFRQWRAELGYSFEEAAIALDCSVRILKYYASNQREIPKRIWLACMQLTAQKSRASRGGRARKIGKDAA